MRKFDIESAVAVIELQQMIADYWAECDFNAGRDAASFYTEDCVAEVSVGTVRGRDGITKYYADMADRQAQSGGRTTRHVAVNVRIFLQDKDRATIKCQTIGFAGGGKVPVAGTAPAAVSDMRIECRRDADGQWRFFEYVASPKFIGGDAYTKNALKRALDAEPRA